MRAIFIRGPFGESVQNVCIQFFFFKKKVVDHSLTSFPHLSYIQVNSLSTHPTSPLIVGILIAVNAWASS